MSINSFLLIIAMWVFYFVLTADPTGTFFANAYLPLQMFVFLVLLLICFNKVLDSKLLEILNVVLVVFFLLRIPFVYTEEFVSDVYIRNVDISKVNYALWILNFQTLALAGTIYFLEPKIKVISTKLTNHTWNCILRYTSLVLFINFIYSVVFFKLGATNYLPNIIAIFLAIFNYGTLLILLVPLLVLANREVLWKHRLNLYFQLLIVVGLVMFSGSKSGLFQIFSIYLVSHFAIRGIAYKIPLKGFLLASIFLTLAIIFFMFGSIFNQIQRGNADFSDWRELASLAFENLSSVLNAVSYRMGYLDFFIDKFSQEIYHSAFKLELYFKAIIDAITPGFDLFQVPLVSRAVYNNFFGLSDGPNSEAVTTFAEGHLLFGYFSFLIYGLVILTLRIFKISSKKSDLDVIMGSVFVVYLFNRYMLGFGIDYWLFGDVIYPFIFMKTSLFFINRLTASRSESISTDTMEFRGGRDQV